MRGAVFFFILNKTNLSLIKYEGENTHEFPNFCQPL